MPCPCAHVNHTNDLESSATKLAVLYARVSTKKQAIGGYSLRQQLEALRQHAARSGYEVLEEIADAGESGASLRRPGLDRMRELVAAGGVSLVLAQDLDRLAREPEHHHLLRREFGERGCALLFLNGRDPDAAQTAKRERARITERSWRGKVRKAREGKILAGTTPNYGFQFNAARDGYEVDEATMRVIRRVFRMVDEEKRTLHAVKRALETEGVSSPSGNSRWSTWVLRRFVLDDVYKPHTFGEIEGLLTPEVAAGLDPERCYGVWWFNRERWTTNPVSDVSGGGRVYRRSVRAVPKPREEWIAVPVPDSGVPRRVVDAARETLLKNRPNSSRKDRFWELSGGILRCGECGWRMRTCTTRKKSGKLYFYYACAKRREGGDACPNRGSYRADVLEPAVWQAVARQLADPEAVRAAFGARMRLERGGAPGDPKATERALLGRIVEADRDRDAYQEMTAKGLMTFDELEARLCEIEESRAIVLRELEEIGNRCEDAEGLERDRDALLGSYAGTDAETLGRLEPEERNRVYRALRLEAHLGADGVLSIEGIAGTAAISVIG